jgi:hypothetical protein
VEEAGIHLDLFQARMAGMNGCFAILVYGRRDEWGVGAGKIGCANLAAFSA